MPAGIPAQLRRIDLLLAAAGSARLADRRRRRVLARMLHRLRQTPEVRIAAFYVSGGTVPRGLWDND